VVKLLIFTNLVQQFMKIILQQQLPQLLNTKRTENNGVKSYIT